MLAGYARLVSVALFLAAASASVASTEERVVIDLLVRQPCEQRDEAVLANDIIVCAERERQAYHQAAPSDRQAGKTLPKAELQLAEGTALAVETESEDMGMARSQRAMVRLKFKF